MESPVSICMNTASKLTIRFFVLVSNKSHVQEQEWHHLQSRIT